MKRWILLLAALPLAAHTISMSTAELKLEGSRGIYELRMPAYEVTHVQKPEQTLFEHVQFSNGGTAAKLMEKTCRQEGQALICNAVYDFGKPVETVDAECTFARITVPNHVHVLKAFLGSKTDQAVFDVTYEKAELRFRPPTPVEIAIRQIGTGMLASLTAIAGLLFLAALALSGRTWRELLLLVAAFSVGEILAAMLLGRLQVEWAPRFVEAAMALSVAYLAVEILFLPAAGGRWIVCGALGLFHGLYFALLIRDTDYQAVYVLGGALVVELVVIAIFWAIVRRFPGMVRYAAMLLMTVGASWFGVRLIK
jgi:hypothetical protein